MKQKQKENVNGVVLTVLLKMTMTFSDEDLLYLSKEQDSQLRS